MPTFYGSNSSDIVYQDDYDTDLTVYGYAGDDQIYLNLTGADGGFNTVYAGSGNDLVKNDFEGGNQIDLGSGNDSYIAKGFSTASNLYDTVYAGSGNDTIDVATWHSDYYGEDGNDAFFSVGFRNSFDGGAGNDTISYESQDDDIDRSGLGMTIDLNRGFAQTIGTSDRESLTSIENAVGTGVADRITGSSVANKLWGDGGNDVIDGKAGNDTLYGGAGNDNLYGGAGNDKLYGGSGSDWLYGGSGADLFVFTSISDSRTAATRDVIKDFSRGDNDYIDLRQIDADTTHRGNQAFDFIGSQNFSGHAGELRFGSDGVVYGDVNGDGRADFQVKVDGFTKMDASDFFL